MTFELTSERLQEIAVGCVTKFIQKQASLNESIAKEAMDLELNPEQTKRVIEASNTIAYLRQLEKSADRTFEFDVADYNKVMAAMCMPDDMLKAAGTPPWLDKDKDSKEDSKEDDKGESKDKKDSDDKDEKKHKGEDFKKKESKDSKDEKEESEDEDNEESDKEDDSEEEKQEKKAMLMKGYFKAVNTLEKMAYDEAGLFMEIIRTAGVVGKESHALEKIAYVVDSQDFDKTLKLCGIEKRAEEDVIFTDAELGNVKKLYSLYKQASEFTKRKHELEDFVVRAEDLLFKQPVDIEKQAFIGGVLARGAGAIAHGVGKMVGGAAKGVGNFGVNTAKNVGAFGRAASQAGYKSTGDAVSAYDKIKKTQGAAAAQAKFGGKKPSVLVHRIGVGGALTALSGASMEHKNNVKDI